ncbi:hypothetical protein [Glaciimonas immobilis]|uniref:Uncharacterized protein n=1 Tax=Glaciimonas immobilis TaxID=728004 RepID=A0A840RRV4_9BURK|nr:hypothetical protein [Glaciimonas immobilis]KAF3999915.1 hypothetical protein HAV38_01690 [Glaciimonas immobilis]MBB5200413.1 hypothetical protein [Glaciimonas immobilis]
MIRNFKKLTSVRWKLVALVTGAIFAMAANAANAANIDFSSNHDFAEINLNIKDQAKHNSEFVVLSVKLTPAATQRLQEVSRSAVNQDLTISLNGNEVRTLKVTDVIKNSRLKLSLTRQMAHDVFPSLLATPVSSVSLSGFPMPQWAEGTWAESLTPDATNKDLVTNKVLSVSEKIINSPTCKRVNHTIVATTDSMVELRIDRRNKCVLDEIPVSKIILSRTTEPDRIVISLYAVGSDFAGPPTRENTYRLE